MNQPIDFDKLPKHRRDWLEIFGNQWGTRKHDATPLTPDEKQALDVALNPFVPSEISAHFCAHRDGWQEPHLCPYGDELYGSTELCRCCTYCERECARDI